MKELTTSDILQLVYSRLRDSELGKKVPAIYKYKYFLNPTGEFIVVTPLANAINDSQIATINVNIYIPDRKPTIGREKQREPNDARINELAKLAIDALKWYDTGERYFFRVEAEAIISEESIDYSFSNIKVKFQNS